MITDKYDGGYTETWTNDMTAYATGVDEHEVACSA